MLVNRILSRLLQSVPTLIGVAIVVFVLIRIVPGNPIAMMLAPGATEDDIQQLKALYGLDKSLIEQFFIWAREALTGNFGTSISLRQDVLGMVLSRLPATLELAFIATFVAVLLGTTLAVVGTRYRGRWPEAVVDTIGGIGQSVPDFIWALGFILVFGVLMPVMPISGRSDPAISFDYATRFYLIESLLRFDFRAFRDLLSHALMPALALGLPLAAIISRVLKSSLAEELTQDYVLLARVKGHSEWRTIVREALRNAAIPTVNLTGVQVIFLIGGSVLVERIFSYPGIGNLSIDAVINRDLPMIQGLVLMFAVLFILVNLALDLLTIWLNPKLRHG